MSGWRFWRRRRVPSGPPAKQVFGPVKISGGLSLETALGVAREWDEQVRRDERADWQESTAILSELMKKKES